MCPVSRRVAVAAWPHYSVHVYHIHNKTFTEYAGEENQPNHPFTPSPQAQGFHSESTMGNLHGFKTTYILSVFGVGVLGSVDGIRNTNTTFAQEVACELIATLKAERHTITMKPLT